MHFSCCHFADTNTPTHPSTLLTPSRIGHRCRRTHTHIHQIRPLRRLQSKRADEVDFPPARATTENVRDNVRGARDDDGDDDEDDDVTSLKEIAAGAPGVNDSQVITQIVEEYDQRLQAQLALAKEDIVNALEEQIQVGGGVSNYLAGCVYASVCCGLDFRCCLGVFALIQHE